MRIIEQRVPASYDLVLFGDNQEGNALVCKDKFKEAIEFIAEGKNRFAIHMGDEMEAFWIDDPRYTPETLMADPLAQQDEVIRCLRPIARQKKLITILYGNHSHRLYPKVGDVTLSTCQKLGIRYGGFACVVSFVDGHGTQWKGFFNHGRKMIRSRADDPVRRLANEKLQLKQHLKDKMGDCLLMAKGHTHKLIVCEPMEQLFLTTEEGEIKQGYTGGGSGAGSGFIHPDLRWYVNTGSFLKCYGENVNSYTEIAELDPIETGYVVVEVRDRRIERVRRVVI